MTNLKTLKRWTVSELGIMNDRIVETRNCPWEMKSKRGPSAEPQVNISKLAVAVIQLSSDSTFNLIYNFHTTFHH